MMPLEVTSAARQVSLAAAGGSGCRPAAQDVRVAGHGMVSSRSPGVAQLQATLSQVGLVVGAATAGHLLAGGSGGALFAGAFVGVGLVCRVWSSSRSLRGNKRDSDAPAEAVDPRSHPIDVGPGLDETWVSQFPLETRGRNIVDAHGRRFRLKSGNWYGASDCEHVVAGLDVQTLEVVCASIAALGFNSVRLPFSNEMLRSLPAPGSINFELNPRLESKNALQVFDEVVRCLGRHQVAVVLNNHTTYGEWCGGPNYNGIWYHPRSKYSEAAWMRDWAMLASRYRNFPHVVGCDLRNEVRFVPWPPKMPCWGAGCGLLTWLGLSADWKAAAVACAERILARNNRMLIIIERMVWPARAVEVSDLLPRFAGRLVIGVHYYSWMGPGRFLPFVTPENAKFTDRLIRFLGIVGPHNWGDFTQEELHRRLVEQCGHLLQDNVCPVWFSEFGAGPDPASYDMAWFDRFLKVLHALEADYAYWPLNGGFKPGTTEYETYGLLGADWRPLPPSDPRLRAMTGWELLPRPAPIDREKAKA